MAAALQASGLPPGRLELEITEGVLYRARIPVPARVPVGTYRAETYLISRGRVLAVKPIEKDPTRPAGRIPIFVPAGSTDSFEVGQRFKCKLRVTRDLLVVEALERF